MDSFAGMRPLTLSHYSGGGALQLSFDDDLKVVSADFSTLAIVVPFENLQMVAGFRRLHSCVSGVQGTFTG